MACRLAGAKPLSEPMLEYYGILLIEPLGTNFGEILIAIQTFSFKKMYLEMMSAKWRPFCLCLIVLCMISILPSIYWLVHAPVIPPLLTIKCNNFQKLLEPSIGLYSNRFVWYIRSCCSWRHLRFHTHTIGLFMSQFEPSFGGKRFQQSLRGLSAKFNQMPGSEMIFICPRTQ